MLGESEFAHTAHSQYVTTGNPSAAAPVPVPVAQVIAPGQVQLEISSNNTTASEGPGLVVLSPPSQSLAHQQQQQKQQRPQQQQQQVPVQVQVIASSHHHQQPPTYYVDQNSGTVLYALAASPAAPGAPTPTVVPVLTSFNGAPQQFVSAPAAPLSLAAEAVLTSPTSIVQHGSIALQTQPLSSMQGLQTLQPIQTLQQTQTAAQAQPAPVHVQQPDRQQQPRPNISASSVAAAAAGTPQGFAQQQYIHPSGTRYPIIVQQRPAVPAARPPRARVRKVPQSPQHQQAHPHPSRQASSSSSSQPLQNAQAAVPTATTSNPQQHQQQHQHQQQQSRSHRQAQQQLAGTPQHQLVIPHVVRRYHQAQLFQQSQHSLHQLYRQQQQQQQQQLAYQQQQQHQLQKQLAAQQQHQQQQQQQQHQHQQHQQQQRVQLSQPFPQPQQLQSHPHAVVYEASPLSAPSGSLLVPPLASPLSPPSPGPSSAPIPASMGRNSTVSEDSIPLGTLYRNDGEPVGHAHGGVSVGGMQQQQGQQQGQVQQQIVEATGGSTGTSVNAPQLSCPPDCKDCAADQQSITSTTSTSLPSKQASPANPEAPANATTTAAEEDPDEEEDDEETLDEEFLLSPQNLLLHISIYPYTADKNDELTFVEGQIIRVIRKVAGGWWEGQLDQQCGWFPANHTTEYPIPHEGVGDGDDQVGPFANTIEEIDQLRLRTIIMNNQIQGVVDANEQQVYLQQQQQQQQQQEKEEKEKEKEVQQVQANQAMLAVRAGIIKDLATSERAYLEQLKHFTEEFVYPLFEE
ncbi:hypothetical protein HK102_006908, partial [Quaeritorhiza haematococci]